MNSSCNVSTVFAVAVQVNLSVLCIKNGSLLPENSSDTATWWMMLLVLLLIGTTVVANLLIILLFIMYRQIRTPFNYILLNIAVGDAVIGIFDMPQFAASYFYWGFWPFSETQCSFWIFVDYLMPAVTMTSVAALSADRFWAVLYPAPYRAYNTNRKAMVIILVTWFLALAGVVPGFTYVRLYFSNQSLNKTCSWNVDGVPVWTSFLSLVLGVWVPFFIALVCYVGTVFKFVKLRLTRTAVGPLGTNNRRMARRDRQEMQAFVVVTLMTVTLFISYSPWIAYLVRLLILKYDSPSILYNVAFWMAYSLSMVNPFVCSAGSRDMKGALKRLCWTGGRQVENRSAHIALDTSRPPAVRQSTV